MLIEHNDHDVMFRVWSSAGVDGQRQAEGERPLHLQSRIEY